MKIEVGTFVYDRTVRRIMHRVDEHFGTSGMCHPGNFLHILRRARLPCPIRIPCAARTSCILSRRDNRNRDPGHRSSTRLISMAIVCYTPAQIFDITDCGIHTGDILACLLKELQQLPRVSTYGVRDPEHIARRVPTICFNIREVKPATVTSELADRAIGVRDGNMYSPRLLKRLGISSDDGAVRASLVHYNTEEEIDRFIEALASLIANSA